MEEDKPTRTLESCVTIAEIKLLSLKTGLQGSVLEVLIYFASERGEKKLPTIGEFVLSEVIAAIIEYLTREEYFLTYRRREDGTESFGAADGWETKTNEAMDKTLARFGGRFRPVLREALKELTKLNFTHDAWGGKGYNSRLYSWYQHKICRTWMESIFSLPVEFIKNVEKKIIPSLDPETIKHCEAIAEIMKKYIDRDVELIKRTYHW